jgi:hypothetical protein
MSFLARQAGSRWRTSGKNRNAPAQDELGTCARRGRWSKTDGGCIRLALVGAYQNPPVAGRFGLEHSDRARASVDDVRTTTDRREAHRGVVG